MSNFSQFVGGGVFITDATLLPRYSVGSSSLLRVAGTTNVAATTVAFYTGGVASIDRIPSSVQDDTNWTADTYKTITTVTGAGYFSGFVGPTAASAGDITTLEVTVDGGTAQEVAMPAQNNGDRVFAGSATGLAFFWGGTQIQPMDLAGTSSDGFIANVGGATNAYVCPLAPHDVWALGGYLVNFTSSLLVRAKHSQNLTTTTARERRSAAILIRRS